MHVRNARLLIGSDEEIPLMEKKRWTRPDFTELNLGCEINCYSPAEI